MSPNNEPKVSCLVVTADRRDFLRRSLTCFINQTYANKELIIVDNGLENVERLIDEFNIADANYIRVAPSSGQVLGDLRNISLQYATGDYITCWDDDDWYHPDRIQTQVKILQNGYDACCLSGSLVHVNWNRFTNHPYRGTLKTGVPSTIMHKKNDQIRYPSWRKKEDSQYLKKWQKQKYIKLPTSYSYLFIRCFHGDNTWGRNHFLRRIRNSPKSMLEYVWYSKIKNNLFEHPKFDLTTKEREAFEMFMEQSKKFDLI